MLRLPLIFGSRRLGPRLGSSGARHLRNSPLSTGAAKPPASRIKLSSQATDKSSPTATSQAMGQDCSSTAACLKENLIPVDEGVVMVDILDCISNGGERQRLENKVAKINTADLWENRLPDLRTTAKASEVTGKERENESEGRLYNPYENVPTAWKLGEDVGQFLARCIPSQTSIAVGPWIWMANPNAEHGYGVGFAAAEALLEEPLAKARQELARIIKDDSLDAVRLPLFDLLNKARDIAKKQHVESLKQTILTIASATSLTVGKWMLFPKPTFADIAWSKVARATNIGKLGVAAKIATSDGSGRSPVICVYTHDFADKEDVMRVLLQLEELGFCNGRTISYKPDIYTHIGLNTGNEYQIPPIIYSSKELLRKE